MRPYDIDYVVATRRAGSTAKKLIEKSKTMRNQ